MDPMIQGMIDAEQAASHWRLSYDHLEHKPLSTFSMGWTDEDEAAFAVRGHLEGLTPFRLYDDDGELYYSGVLVDDDQADNQAAALMWGEVDSGCTTIKVLRGGAWVQDIG